MHKSPKSIGAFKPNYCCCLMLFFNDPAFLIELLCHVLRPPQGSQMGGEAAYKYFKEVTGVWPHLRAQPPTPRRREELLLLWRTPRLMNPGGPAMANVINIYLSLIVALLGGSNEASLLAFDIPCQILHFAQLFYLSAELVRFSRHPLAWHCLIPQHARDSEYLNLPGWGQMGRK